MENQRCAFCNKPTKPAHNYCDWGCQIEHAKADGGQVLQPNGLPIRCVTHDGTMLEHEHGDHPDYKWPVEVLFTGEITPGLREEYGLMGGDPNSDEDCRSYESQTHALLYTDGRIAVTLYECCYAVWNAETGANIAGSLWKDRPFRLVSTRRPSALVQKGETDGTGDLRG